MTLVKLRPEQAKAIEALAAANGATLSYADLEVRGVQRPAVVGYELAAAGYPVTRVVVRGPDGHRHVGLRMLPVTADVPEARPPRRPRAIPGFTGIFK